MWSPTSGLGSGNTVRAILTYHSVDGSGSPISVAPEVFEEHAEWFRSGVVRVVPLARLFDPGLEGPAIAVTFDDGFANVAGALAALADHGVPATVFVVTGHVGGDNAWGGRPAAGIPTMALMGWHELGLLAERGVELGAHTRTHPRLTELGADEVAAELEQPVTTMSRELGVTPRCFAYPYGAVSPTAVAQARARYQWSCTTELRTLGSSEDPQALPRLDMYYWRRPGAIAQLLRPSLAARVWVRRQARRIRAMLAP